MTRYAAIDFGTNSTRLLAVDHDGTAIARELRVTRLGQGVDGSGRLAPEAIERTVSAAREFRNVLDRLEVEEVAAFATSAARDAENGQQLLDELTATLRSAPQLLSGAEEARLTHAGAVADLPPGNYVVIDIGGGSTEFAWVQDGQLNAHSLDIGCVRLTERLLEGDPYSASSLVRLDAACVEALSGLPAVEHLAGNQLVGVAGTLSTLAAVDLALTSWDRERVHLHRLSVERIEDLADALACADQQTRLGIAGIPADRADVITAGAVMIRAAMRWMRSADVLVSEADNLDGMISRMRETTQNV